ncbi:hypothetical protein [Rhizobium sp. CF142]|uniref:hypothetical protein n=1 Tax=Rhizobium sp. CF142 TaxID=1144314 RepID=UPI00026EF339|nr:hypothetical protein [Rhizobium sp. CF142]EJJ26566.1 hypothetical protein PMI11_05200 [Rhizobium sp. CF142]
MFEVGENYEFRVIEDGDQVTFTGIIERYEHPLVKLKDTPAYKQVATTHSRGWPIQKPNHTPGKLSTWYRQPSSTRSSDDAIEGAGLASFL